MEVIVLQIFALVYASSQSVFANNLSIVVPEPSIVLGTVTDSVGCYMLGSFKTKSHLTPNRLLLVNVYICKYGIKVASQGPVPCAQHALCDFCVDKSIIYSQSNPSGYFQCMNERFIPFSCPSDSVFVPATQKCEKGNLNYPQAQRQPGTEDLKSMGKNEGVDDRHLNIHLIQQFYTKLLNKEAWHLENDKASEQIFDEMYLNSSFHSVEFTSYNLSKSALKIRQSKNNFDDQTLFNPTRGTSNSNTQPSQVPTGAYMQPKTGFVDNTKGLEEVANSTRDKSYQFMLPLALYLHSKGTKESYSANGYELALPANGLVIVMKNHAINFKAIGNITLDDNSDIQRVSLSSTEFKSKEVSNLIYLSHSQDNFEFQEDSEQETIIKQALNHKSLSEKSVLKSVFLSLPYVGLPSESFAAQQMSLIRFASSLKVSKDPVTCVASKTGESIEPLENADSMAKHTPLKKDVRTVDEGVQTDGEISQNDENFSNSEEVNEPLSLSKRYPGTPNHNLHQFKSNDNADTNNKTGNTSKLDKGRRAVDTDDFRLHLFNSSNASEIPIPIIQTMLTQIDQTNQPFKLLKLTENGIIFNAIVVPTYNQTLMKDSSNANFQKPSLNLNPEPNSIESTTTTSSGNVKEKNVYASHANLSVFDKLETFLKEYKDLEILKTFLERKLKENPTTEKTHQSQISSTSTTKKPTKSFSSAHRDRQEDYYSDVSSESNISPKLSSKPKPHPVTNTNDSNKKISNLNINDNVLPKIGKDDVKQTDQYKNNHVQIFTQQRQVESTTINNTDAKDINYEAEPEPIVRSSGDIDLDYVTHVLIQDPKIQMKKDANTQSATTDGNENSTASQKSQQLQSSKTVTKAEQESAYKIDTRKSYLPEIKEEKVRLSTIGTTTSRENPITSPRPPTQSHNQLTFSATYSPEKEQAIKGLSTSDYDYYYIQDSDNHAKKRATGEKYINFRRDMDRVFQGANFGNRPHKDFDYVQYT